MNKSAPKRKSVVFEIFVYVSAVSLLLLTTLNLHGSLSQKQVLGVSTNDSGPDKSIEYWVDFLNKHPNYIPGWIELDREDKVREIDPNYLTP